MYMYETVLNQKINAAEKSLDDLSLYIINDLDFNLDYKTIDLLKETAEALRKLCVCAESKKHIKRLKKLAKEYKG